MQERSQSFRIDPEMVEYIKSRSSDLRISTTCEGPLIFSVKISPPKPADQVVQVGERKLYISAVQAPYIKVIDAKMLPRCALERSHPVQNSCKSKDRI